LSVQRREGRHNPTSPFGFAVASVTAASFGV
jgi:hypothetical protein